MVLIRYVSGSGQMALLVETPSQSGWEPQAPAPPAVGSASTFPNFGGIGLACPIPGDCTVAADSNLSSSGKNDTSLIYALSRGAWTRTRLPLPPGAGQGRSMEIDDLACPGAGDCVAVGRTASFSAPDTGALAVIATLHDGTWTVADAPLPGNAAKGYAANAYLYGVTCPAPGSCVAVGGYTEAPSNPHPLIETLANGAWQPATGPMPFNANSAELNDVACPAAGSCVAVGYYSSGEGAGTPGLIETLESGIWRVTPAPEPADSPDRFGGSLFGVACPAPGSCVAVGFYYSDQKLDAYQSLIDTLTGVTWMALTGQLPEDAATSSQSADLSDVACPPTGACQATGSYTGSANTSKPFVESAVFR